MDDAALVVAARSEPERGFAAIYQRCGDRIHDYCLAVLRQRDDAADATQDTFLIAYERLGQLRDPGRLMPWLYAIARSRCLRRIRDRGRQRPTDDLEPLGPAEPPVTGDVEAAELRQLVWDAAAGLSDDDRAVLDLHLRHGLSGADLASALGVPAEKANLMLHRMKQRMGRSVGALLVARTGRADCPDLAALTTGQLTPLVRKRLARHVEQCATCRERRDRLTPELLYASVPLVPAPALLGELILERTSGSGPTDGSAAVSSEQMQWQADGFPRPEPIHEPMPVPHRLAVGAGVAALAVLGLLGGGVVGRTIADSDPPPAAPVAVESGATGTTPGPATRPGPGTDPAPPPANHPGPTRPGSAPPTGTPSPPVPPPTVQITSPASGSEISDPNVAMILNRTLGDPLGEGLTETWSVSYPYDPVTGTGASRRPVEPLALFPFGFRWRPIDTFGDDWCEVVGMWVGPQPPPPVQLLLALEVQDGAGRAAADQVVLNTSPCIVVD